MATIRVFLVTYKRPTLLRRALASLRAQTFTDWVCELHNDAPDDDAPRQIVEELGDVRITYHGHRENWGPVATFNHVFAGASEPFASMLEDDNWWEPRFLETALAALTAQPAADIAWANMKLWREEANGGWTDTGGTIWPIAADATPRLLQWPQLLQAFDALHSNGAMLVRARAFGRSVLPARVPFVHIEAMRERTFPGGLLLLTEPLANFALTRTTARGHDRVGWTQSQLLVAGSFFKNVPVTPAALDRLWRQRRALRPRSTNILFLLAFAGVGPRGLLLHARGRDWLWFLLNFVRHPRTHLRALRFRSTWPEAWEFLTRQTAARTAEARQRGFTALGADSLLTKHPSESAA